MNESSTVQKIGPEGDGFWPFVAPDQDGRRTRRHPEIDAGKLPRVSRAIIRE